MDFDESQLIDMFDVHRAQPINYQYRSSIPCNIGCILGIFGNLLIFFQQLCNLLNLKEKSDLNTKEIFIICAFINLITTLYVTERLIFYYHLRKYSIVNNEINSSNIHIHNMSENIMRVFFLFHLIILNMILMLQQASNALYKDDFSDSVLNKKTAQGLFISAACCSIFSFAETFYRSTKKAIVLV